MGYHQASFEVVGVDIDPKHKKRYPFEFIHGDALEIGRDLLQSQSWDLVHASPPCQKYSDLQKRTGKEYPDLIPQTRELLQDSGVPYVIENVDTAPLLNPVMLCGTMFEELRVYRHRLFETSFELAQPDHPKHVAKVYTYDRRKAHFGRDLTDDMFIQVTGGGNAPVPMKRKAMGIDWMANLQLNQAIPPAYSKWIGEQWIAQKS